MKAGKSSKSWREKLEKEAKPKIVDIPALWAGSIGDGKMLVPTALLVDKLVKQIPKGRLTTVNGIREKLAEEFKADITCPLTTGIFLNIVANTAEEDLLKGKMKVSPYWRVLKKGGKLNAKFPGGTARQAALLQQEGFKITGSKGMDNNAVKDFESRLMSF
jgi:hypothetical protein